MDVLQFGSGVSLWRGEFQGEHLASLRIFDLVHGTHSALSDVPDNAVPTDLEIVA